MSKRQVEEGVSQTWLPRGCACKMWVTFLCMQVARGLAHVPQGGGDSPRSCTAGVETANLLFLPAGFHHSIWHSSQIQAIYITSNLTRSTRVYQRFCQFFVSKFWRTFRSLHFCLFLECMIPSTYLHRTSLARLDMTLT
jgi:hypothetical protein